MIARCDDAVRVSGHHCIFRSLAFCRAKIVWAIVSLLKNIAALWFLWIMRVRSKSLWA